VNNNLISYLLVLGLISISIFVIAETSVDVPMTIMQIERQAPNITLVQLNDDTIGDDSIILNVNNYTTVNCFAYVFDIDGFHDINGSWARIWNTYSSSYDGVDDYRYHYTNDTCLITEYYGVQDANAIVNCSFNVLFYANYSEWNCTISVNDTRAQFVNGSDNASIESLIAIDITNTTIDWGILSLDTDYAANIEILIENQGNTPFDLEADVYNDSGLTDSNYSFNCDIGYIPSDSVVYNLSQGAPYSESSPFTNLSLVNIDYFDLFAQNDSSEVVPSNKTFYMGINIPPKPTINGTCSGYVRFNAVDAR
jgi:hypothetical protein